MTKKVAGKTVSVHLKPGPELDKATAEVASYKRFKSIVNEIVEISETICENRPASRLADTIAAKRQGDEKGGSARRSATSSRRK